MGEKSNTNVYWYIIALFIIVLFVVATQQFANAMFTNPQITLTNESFDHITRILNIDMAGFNVTQKELEDNPAYANTNDTGSQAKDYALEFFYSRSAASEVWVITSNVVSIPGYITTLLNIPDTPTRWLISILNWFWRLMLIIAVYYFIRGIK